MSVHAVNSSSSPISWRRDAVRVLVGTGAVLLLPLIAMQFTREVAWSAGDFAVAAVLLTVSGFAFLRLLHSRRPRWLLGAVLVLAVYVWLELAVGIVFGIGS